MRLQARRISTADLVRETTAILTVHPAEALSWHHLEVDSLVTVLGVDQVRQLDCIELRSNCVSLGEELSEPLVAHLLRDHTIEIDESGGHPVTSSESLRGGKK